MVGSDSIDDPAKRDTDRLGNPNAVATVRLNHSVGPKHLTDVSEDVALFLQEAILHRLVRGRVRLVKFGSDFIESSLARPKCLLVRGGPGVAQYVQRRVFCDRSG